MIIWGNGHAKRDESLGCFTRNRKKRTNFSGMVGCLIGMTLVTFILAPQPSVPAVELPSPLRKVVESKKENFIDSLPSNNDIEKRIKDLKEYVKTAKSAVAEQNALQIGVTLADLQKRISRLEATLVAYERLQTALQQREILKEEETHLEKRLQTQLEKDVDQKTFYSLSAYDGLLDELAALEQQKETVDLAAKLARSAFEDVTETFEKDQKEWRNLKEKLETTPEKARASRLVWDLETARLQRNHSEAMTYLERVNIENFTRKLKISEFLVDLTRRKSSYAEDHLTFDETDLAKQLKSLENREKELRNQIQTLIEAQESTEKEWSVVSRQIKQKPGDKPDITVEEASKAREAWRMAYQEIREQKEDMIRLLGYQEELWNIRYALIKGGRHRDDAIAQRDEIETQVKNMSRLLGVQQRYQNSVRSQMSALERRLSEKDIDPTLKSHLLSRQTALQGLIEGRFEYISTLLATESMARRTLDEITLRANEVSLKDKFTELLSSVRDIWNFEIWVIDERPVTVRKLIVAFIILVIGILVARYFLRAVGSRFFAYARIKESTALGIQKVFRYVAYLLVLILALRMVNIPLAAFAFLGGAVAIGLGFGAQNLINNFISGFIIMGERPINIGNIVEVDGVLGQVEEIGARSTRIRTGENIHILVPNSSFLEKNIINWTLSDRQIRAHVTVGVRYGSPVQDVERLLLESIRENEKVLKSPAPFVIFEDFGDNALIFQVHFWISIFRIIERRMIESRIRFQIDKVFREANIVIAFPQRDVHLDSETPIEIRLIEKKDE